jgi:hypothetical protein
LPHQASLEYEDVMSRYGTVILIMLVFPWVGGSSAVNALLRPLIDILLKIFI